MNLPGDGLVPVEMTGDDDQMGTTPPGLRHRHCRMNTERTCFIAGSRDHTARSVEAHGDGLPTQSGIISLLHRSKESIHVNMNYLAHYVTVLPLQRYREQRKDRYF